MEIKIERISVFALLFISAIAIAGCQKKVDFNEVTNKQFDCTAIRNGDSDPKPGTMMVWATNGRANLRFYNMDSGWFAGVYRVNGAHFRIDFRAEAFENGAMMPIPGGMHFEGDFIEATSDKMKIKGIMGGNTDSPTTIELDCRAPSGS
ncbi:hypothetical protein [Burkholderia stagnalis]|uniref:hypothetical protein n=1 Tax=Burkholderia stagnalis TaxID=1503054 RepID=UPI000F5F52C9|nr:hypothetical protein [Burkholderia stagnalis]